MNEPRHKYPRTHHLPWSPGATDDDKMLSSVSHFEGRRVVVTEKMDGENCTIGRTYTHARSKDSAHHPSRAWVKQLASQIGYQLPEGFRLCGENLYAKHSLGYTDLPGYFLWFSIWDGMSCLSWEETKDYAELLGLPLVPVLYEGEWDERLIKKLWQGRSVYGTEGEGYVVRLAEGFAYDTFAKSVAKFVRPSHVQTDEHWMAAEINPNQLGSEG